MNQLVLVLLMAWWLAFPSAVQAQGAFPYQDTTLSIGQRTQDLLSRMTIEEKAAQTYCIRANGEGNTSFMQSDPLALDRLKEQFPHSVGQVANPGGTELSPLEIATLTNQVQQYFVEQTRLGIPVVFHKEALHGFEARDAISFPQAIALASTWDTVLIERIFRVAAREARAVGITQVLTPVVDVALDARWGRVEETYGEDPYLVSRMGVAAVHGLQGRSARIGQNHVIATLKHFAAYGQPEGGMNFGPVNVSERTLREVFFPPFKAAVQEAGVGSVMAAHHEIDAVPCHANAWLLTEVLRKEWGFPGFTVSDYTDIARLHSLHHVAKDTLEAARLALTAGMDVELPLPSAYLTLPTLVASGQLSESVLDTAVARILRYKFLVGLFEHPYVDPPAAQKIVGDTRHQPLALEAARKAITLVKNQGNVLPLNKDELKTVAVIGPNADRVLLGGYSGVPKHFVTVLEGMQRKLGPDVRVVYSEGCKIIEKGSRHVPEVIKADPEKNKQRIAAAVAVAQDADVIILALGGNEVTSREAYGIKTHLGDRASLDLLGSQDELVAALKQLNKPMVALLFHGSPLAFSELNQQADAILECWYLGQEAGHAVADVLLGDYNPAGKLPISIPRSVGHIPVFYNYKPTARKGYLLDDVSPLYPFGFGLSYTTFTLGAPRLERDTIGVNESVKVLIDVQNTGERAGDEVIQLYIRDAVSSVTRPVQELKDFARVHLAPNETKTVALSISPEKLAFYTRDMHYLVEPGEFEIMVGNSSKSYQSTTLTVTL